MTNAETVTDGDEECRTTVRPNERPSDAVVRLVASVRECDPLDLEPLGRAIDPDALDALFAERPDGLDAGSATVSFSYCGYALTINGTEAERVRLKAETKRR